MCNPVQRGATVTAYASNTGTRRNLEQFRRHGWRILLTPDNPTPREGLRYGIASRRAKIPADTLLDLCFEKLEINKAREWSKPTSDEPIEHVRAAESDKQERTK